MNLRRTDFGKTANEENVSLFTLSDESGFAVTVTDWGATITSILAPDRYGNLADVVLGYDKLTNYLANPPYFGSSVGRFCNRIAGGRFELAGNSYTLTQNEGDKHLHGGSPGFSHLLWNSRIVGDSVQMLLHSPEGEQGYPGNLEVSVSYRLGKEQDLHIEFEAQSDADTIINLTNHSYFNLRGTGKGNTQDHLLQIDADTWLPFHEDGIPTGEIRPVEGSDCDFCIGRPIGGAQFNHYFFLNNDGHLERAAKATEPTSGRILEVYTNQPGIMLYNGFSLDEPNGKSDIHYKPFSGFCLETQRPPNAPNEPTFPSVLLKSNETFRSKTIFKFSSQ